VLLRRFLLKIEFTRLHPFAQAPKFARHGDAGADITTVEDFVLEPGKRAIVPTGIAIALPDGYAAFVHPRSGLAAKHGISVVNAPGTIDSGYRGEVKVILINHGDEAVKFHVGDRIAQLVIQRYESVEFTRVDSLDETERGINGFGSTGTVSV
jgi:dUTP pyrophosphatase